MFNHPNISDKAIQSALDEYNDAIGAEVSQWHAMKHAVETAMDIEKKRFPKKTEEQHREDLGYILLAVSAAALVIGMIARWLV